MGKRMNRPWKENGDFFMKGIKTLEQGKSNIVQMLGFFVLLFVLSMISAICFDDNGILNGVKYSLFQIFGMHIPGLAILVLICTQKLSQIEILIYSYVLGYGCSLIIYFVTMPFGFKSAMLYFYIIIFIISLAYIIYIYRMRKWRFEVENDRIGFKVCCIIGMGILFVEVVMSCGLHTLPLKQPTSSYQDFLFGVGNTIECSKEYPIINFRAIFQGKYFYHYMHNLHLATMKNILDIPAYHLTAFYSYIQTVLLLVGGSYLFFQSVLGKKKQGVVFGMLLVLLTTGYESAHRMTYLAHLYMTPNNFDVSMAFGMILVSVVYRQTKSEKVNLTYLIISIISFIISFGSKAPLGMIAASVCGVLGILYVIRRRKVKMILPYAILFLACGTIIYTKVLSGNAEASVKLTASAEENSIFVWGLMPDVQNWLINTFGNLPKWLEQLLLGVYFSVVSYYPVFIVFLVGIIGCFLYYKDVRIIDAALFSAVPVGIGITMLFSHPGGSQYYFLLGTLPFAAALGLRGIYKIMYNQKERICKQMLPLLCCFCICFGVLNVYCATDPLFTMNEFRRGFSYIAGQTVETEEHHSWLANLVYPEEYEGYVWLRENTNERDVLISDMCIAGYTRYTYAEGVFSERYVYIPLEEDLDEIRTCYKGKEKAIRKVMDKADVKYMVQTLRVTPDLKIPKSLGTPVFENDAMRIYKLHD